MLVQKPPVDTLIDTLIHRSYEGEGDYNKPFYGEYINVDFVRIDRKPKYAFTSDGKQLLRNAKVFCYYSLTTPLPDFKEQDMVIFDGEEHKVISAAVFKEPYVNQTYSYELEVI